MQSVKRKRECYGWKPSGRGDILSLSFHRNNALMFTTENEKAKKKEEDGNGKPKHASPPVQALTPTRKPPSRENSTGKSDLNDGDNKEDRVRYDSNQSFENLLKVPEFVADFTQYLTDAGFVDAVYCYNELQSYKTLQKGIHIFLHCYITT